MGSLINALWDDAPPPSARKTTHGYIRRLRQHLAAADDGDRLVTRGHGYLLTVADSELDLHRFTALCAATRADATTGDWRGAAGHFQTGLELWRGDPLADVSSAALQREEAPALADRRLQALQSRIEADLHLGRHAQAVPELQRLTRLHPLRDAFHQQLMLALYRCGRQAEALAAYRSDERQLRDEIGVVAGPALHRLHQRILAG